MFEAVAEHLKAAAGVATVKDLGCVWTGHDGPSRCDVCVSIEIRREAWYFCVNVSHSRGRSFRKTRVVKWPYSRTSMNDITAVIADLKVVENALTDTTLEDRRTGLGRWFDNLTGRDYRGCHTFSSPLDGALETCVTAEIAASGKTMLVTLTERPPRRSFIMAHIPLEAFAEIRTAADTLR